MSKAFAIGDIHGSYIGLCQCLDRSGFNWKEDTLYVLGDVCDGWPQVREAVDLLLSIPNLIYLMGNHDTWAYEWMRYGLIPSIWTSQGGLATMKSYNYKQDIEHMLLFARADYVHVDRKGNLFVHGGIKPDVRLDENVLKDMTWDRDMVKKVWATNKGILGFNKIFVGHTTTNHFEYGKNAPIIIENVIMLDTGAGWEGKLTIMDIDTLEYWQSDFSSDLYPTSVGRR